MTKKKTDNERGRCAVPAPEPKPMSWRLWDSLQRDINKKSLPPEEAPDDSYIYRGLRPTEAEGRKHAPNNEFQTDQYGNVLDGEENE